MMPSSSRFGSVMRSFLRPKFNHWAQLRQTLIAKKPKLAQATSALWTVEASGIDERSHFALIIVP